MLLTGPSTHYRNIYLDQQIYFFTSSIVGYQPILEGENMKRLVLEAWSTYRDKYHVLIHAYVIMPEHFHLMIYAERTGQIRSFMQQSLRLSAISLLTEIEGWKESIRAPLLKKFQHYANGKAKYKVWKEQTRGVPLQSDRMVTQRLKYIHENPMRRGLVKDPLDYIYSSFRNYQLDDKSIFQVDIL